MNAESTDDRLREALLGGGEGSLEIEELDLLRIQRALEGDLSRDELDELLRRATSEPALARAWRLARELRAELGTEPVRPSTGRPGHWVWGSAAAAAAVAALLVVAVRAPEPPVERAPERATIGTAVPDSSALPRAAFRLAWGPVIPGARYTVEVLDENLELVDRATDLDAAEHTVPAVALERLEAGSILYWRVEALLPDGERLSSPTFVQTVD